MATKIRLQRHGSKRKPFYHVVIADARAKRDGKFIEKIGTYNPTTNPATIDLQFDRALSWLQTGAQPTDTVRSILSYTGVLYKNHLDKGVTKGAISEADADKKFLAWVAEKEAKIQAKKDGLSKSSNEAAEKTLAAEKAVNDERAKAIAEKNAPEVEEVVEETPEATTEEVVEAPVEAAEETKSEEE
jgi:small subunit ribosomal protein S16